MHVAILGATGRIGRLAVEEAVDAGHDVTAIAGHPSPGSNVTSIAVDIRDAAGLRRALASVDGIIVALGPRANRLDEELALGAGMRNLVQAASEHGIERVVALSGAGVDVPGDHKPFFDRAVSRFVRLAARHVVGAKQREYEVLAESDLEWTALRPALVTDGPNREYRLGLQLRPGARVTRRAVARALVDQLSDHTFARQAPFILPS